MIVGLISDTHGLLRPEALTALAGCELILHAGDVGKPEILERLGSLAPVGALPGNIDKLNAITLTPARSCRRLGVPAREKRHRPVP